MNGYINGFGLNGAAFPSWIVRAVVVATAVATVSVAQTRTTYAAAYGDAVAVVSLTQTHTIAARATASCTANASVAPTLKYAGHSLALAEATGNGAVRRDVFATAGADATCYGEALTAQAIGTASSTAASSVVLARAHIIFPGRSTQLCVASASGAGDVTRYPTVLSALAGVLYNRGEASVKRSGTSYFVHDGYVPLATATATADIPNDRLKIIATLGTFDFADCTGTSRAFIRQPGRALGTGINTAQPVVAQHIHRPSLTANAGCTGTAAGVRTVKPQVLADAAVSAPPVVARIKYVAFALADAAASMSTDGLRTAMGGAFAAASASVAKPIVVGTQNYAAASVNAAAVGVGEAWQKFVGAGTGTAQAVGVQAAATMRIAAAVNTTMASATAILAYAQSNADVLAPDERYMIVTAEDRGMIVYAEDRTMVVTA